MIKKQETTIIKQRTTIIICAIAFVFLLVLYFAVVKPLLKEEIEEIDPPTLLEGEVLGLNNRILLFPQAQMADILSIEVHNEHGTFTFYRGYKGDNKNFYIKDMEGAPYNLDMFTSLAVNAGYPLSMKRLDDMNKDLSVYGLAESDSPAWFLLTRMDGKTHKVFIGDKIKTGGGYYCLYEGRDAVYILDATIESTLLADVKTLITPNLGYPISTDEFRNVEDFQIIKNGKHFVSIDTVPFEEGGEEDGMVKYSLEYPTGYTLNISTYTMLLQAFTNFSGGETVACGNDVIDLDAAMLKEKYRIDLENPYYFVHYKCSDIDTYITFSEPDENGDMYAYSSIYNLVAKTNINSATFIEWGLINFVQPTVFSQNINDVSKIEISGKIDNGEEKLDVDAYFTLEGEGDTLKVKPNGSNTAYDADSLNYFRKLYNVMLLIRIQDYSDITDITAPNVKELATMKVELDDGEILEYKFYSYSTRRCFYTVNGKGEFYVHRDAVEKLLRDTNNMLLGRPIEPEAKN